MSANKFLLLAAFVASCLAAFAFQYRPGADDAMPDQVQQRFRFDERPGVYRLIYADGREEIECANGQRRPFYRITKLIQARGWDHLEEADLLRTIPPRCFPVVITRKKRDDSPLIFSLDTGEVFCE